MCVFVIEISVVDGFLVQILHYLDVSRVESATTEIGLSVPVLVFSFTQERAPNIRYFAFQVSGL